MLLLDTHALVWLATDLPQLGDGAKAAIRDHARELRISAISALEISLLVEHGRLKWGRDPRARFCKALKHHRVAEIPVDGVIAWRSGSLPPIHRDPFDRVIVATAQSLGMAIVTRDRTIPRYPGVKVVWD